MDDVFSQPVGKYGLADFRLSRMVLSPTHWRSFRVPVRLAWRAVRFHRANGQSVPDNASGVYTFVVKPGIAHHPSCSYLIYVGKVERQTLRERFFQYFDEKAKGDESRRIHVTQMLLKWDGFLWFYYAQITDRRRIGGVEDALLAAYLPPSNRTFPSRVRKALAKLFAH